jgi:pimeloyl-ACP methyl ester carboxylesterase
MPERLALGHLSKHEKAVSLPETMSTTSRVAEFADLAIHLTESGAGPTLVVLHHSTGPLWAPFHARLSTSFHVLAPEMPGYGLSTRPVTARHPVHLATLLNQMFTSLELDQIDLVGLGLGGWVAAELAAMDQRRLRTLTLVGAAGIRPREGLIHDPMAESWTAYARQCFRDPDHFNAVFGEDPPQEVIDVWDNSREMTARVTWKPWMWSLQLPALLKGVSTPALVIWGGADQVVPVDTGRQYAEALGASRLEIIEDAGHAVELEEPERVAELITAFALTA